MLLRVLLISTLAVVVYSDQVVINQAIDQLLDSAKLALRMKGSNKIQMKNIDKTFKTKIFGMQVPGSFTAKGGYLEDLATLHRTGDVVMATEGNALRLRASMGFDLLHIFYGQYSFMYLSVASSGTMEAKMSGSSASASISVVRSGEKCVVSVDHASLDSLGKMNIKLTGSQVLNQFVTMLANWILENFHDTIQAVANAKIMEAMQKGATKTDLCKHLPH